MKKRLLTIILSVIIILVLMLCFIYMVMKIYDRNNIRNIKINEIVCKNNESSVQEGVKIEKTIKYVFHDEKIASEIRTTKYIIDEDESNIYIKEYKKSVDKELKKIYGKYKGVERKVKSDEESIITILEIDYLDMKKSDKKELFVHDSEKYDKLYNELISDDSMTCTKK